MPGPTFLSIGAPRSGTTWLNLTLTAHPEVTRLPIKELRHFGDNPWRPGRKRTKAEERIKDGEHPEWWKDWLNKWASSSQSDSDYLDLFEGIEGHVGDFSPSYVVCDEATVSHISSVVGSVPVFLNVRDPIDRDWSQAKLTLGELAKESDDDCIDFFQSDFCALRSNYIRALDLWSELFPVHTITFDALQENEKAVAISAFNVLELDPSPVTKNMKRRHPSKAPSGDMSRKVYNFLREHHQDQIRELANRFDGHFSAWRSKHYA